MIRFVIKATLLAAVLAAACGQRSREAHDQEVRAKVEAYRDMMCACRDQACAEKVQADMQRWGSEEAKHAATHHVDPAFAKQLAELTTKYSECQQQALGVPTGESPPPAEKLFDADRIIKHTYDGKGAFVVSQLALYYVDAHGKVDATYGRVDTEYGHPRPPDPADDPKRPIGAPVAPRAPDPISAANDCPHYTWTAGIRERRNANCLALQILERPRCTVLEVWQRAIKGGAPDKGLAVVQLLPTDTARDIPQHWTFNIDDEPRRIHVAQEIRDDCQPVVEKP